MRKFEPGQLGWMWFDNSSVTTLAQKAARAIEAYKAKHGHAPDTCFVNLGAVECGLTVRGVEVVPLHNVLPHHFWLCVVGESVEKSPVQERLF